MTPARRRQETENRPLSPFFVLCDKKRCYNFLKAVLKTEIWNDLAE